MPSENPKTSQVPIARRRLPAAPTVRLFQSLGLHRKRVGEPKQSDKWRLWKSHEEYLGYHTRVVFTYVVFNKGAKRLSLYQ